MQRFGKQLAQRASKPRLLSPVSLRLTSTRFVSSTAADDVSKADTSNASAPKSPGSEHSVVSNWLVLGGTAAAAALGYYYYAASDRKEGKKLANVATAGSVLSHKNPDYDKETGGVAEGGKTK